MTIEVFATLPTRERRLVNKIIQRSNGQIIIAVIDFKGQIRGTSKGLKTIDRTMQKVLRILTQLHYRGIEFKPVEEIALLSAAHGG